MLDCLKDLNKAWKDSISYLPLSHQASYVKKRKLDWFDMICPWQICVSFPYRFTPPQRFQID